MNSNSIFKALDLILSVVKEDDIGLPSPGVAVGGEKEFAERIMKEVEGYIGQASSSDYYSTSRDRFATMVGCAKRHLSPGARVLDIGNAPGYLAYAFHKAGYRVTGLNLSDAWLGAYPNPEMAELFDVRSCDIEAQEIPFPDGFFDAILFTEVLEHIAIKNPKEILPEFRRVLTPGGVVIFSTPNVCNISNIVSLMMGGNVFWPVQMFFGSTDRHNREFTPKEVRALFEEGGFEVIEYFGMNDHANWRKGTQEVIYSYLPITNVDHPLLRNTVVGVFSPVYG